MWILTILVFIVLIPVVLTVNENARDHPEIRLRKMILKENDPIIRPIKDYLKPIILEHDLYLLNILEVDEYKQTISTSVWTHMHWTDDFLHWNMTEFGGIKSIVVPGSQIWMPDYCISNKLSESKCSDVKDKLVVLEHTGRVIYWDFSEMKTKCDIVIKKFPFDVQTCVIKIGLGVSDDDRVVIEPMHLTINLSNYEQNGEWIIYETFYEKKLLPGEKNFTEIHYIFKIRRRPLYYVLEIIIPVIILSVLDIFCFLLPTDGGEKMGMSMSIFLTFAVFLTLINEETPKSSENIFALGFYLCWLLILSAIVVLSQVIILRVYHKKEQEKTNSFYQFIAKHFSRDKSKGAKAEKYETNNTLLYNSGSSHNVAVNSVNWTDIAESLERLFLYLILVTHVTSIFIFLCYVLV